MLSASEFRILFHLCDCHNPSAGCFPTQAYLIDAAGVSNGTLNAALKSMEVKGLIKRHRTFDNETKRRRPTRYMLGFEIDPAQDPTPKSGDGSGGSDGGSRGAKPSPKSGDGSGASKGGKKGSTRLRPAGDGAISNLTPKPSPISPRTHLQPTGEVTCKEPVNNQRVGARPLFFTADEHSDARDIVKAFEAGKLDDPSAVSARMIDCILVGRLITEDQAEALGWITRRAANG